MDQTDLYHFLSRCDELLRDTASRADSPRQGDVQPSGWEELLAADEAAVRDRLYQAFSEAAGWHPELRDLLTQPPPWELLDGRQLKQLVKLLYDAFLSGGSVSAGLQNAFEWTTGRYAAREGRDGAFYAPRQLAELAVALLQPKGGDIYDPCCGSGGMLLAMADALSKRGAPFRLYGQEEDGAAWCMAKISLLLCGWDVDLGGSPSYALASDRYGAEQMDHVICSPPFNDRTWRALQKDAPLDPRWQYGVPPKNRGGLAWLQYMLYVLKPGGEMGVILNTSVLESDYSSERRIRLGLVENDLVSAILLLPPGMFYNTRTDVSFWLLQKGGRAACSGRVLLIDASGLGTSDGNVVRLDAPAQRQILETYRSYRQDGFAEQPGFCTTVSAAEILKRDGVLHPKRYIEYAEAPLPAWEELREREQDLCGELQELFEKNKRTLDLICADG